MRRACRLAIAGTLLMGLLFLGSPAEAGGSTFSFTWRYVFPGQEIHGRALFSVDAASETGTIDEGPYSLYMLRGDAFIEPPVIPERAIFLGAVDLNALGGHLWRATISFIVPDVTPGLYTMSLCNHPCREQFVGDLMGSWVHVVATPEEARLRNLLAQTEQRLEARVDETISAPRQQVDALRAELSATEATSRQSVSTLSNRLDELTREASRLEATASARNDGGSGGLWLAGWLVAAAIGSAWLISVRRRRTPPQDIGQSPPGELVWLSEELEPVP